MLDNIILFINIFVISQKVHEKIKSRFITFPQGKDAIREVVFTQERGKANFN